MTCTCVPYEWDWSQDVEKYALDLVLSFFTHGNTVQAIAVASTEARFSHRTPYQKTGWSSGLLEDGNGSH